MPDLSRKAIMSVVVKIHEARVDYDTADHIQELDSGTLQVFADDQLVGIHPQGKWTWAAVHKDEEFTAEDYAQGLILKVIEDMESDEYSR